MPPGDKRAMPARERIYLDHAATTGLAPDVLATMLPYFAEGGLNASSLHAEGRRARAGLDEARETVARLLGARSPREIVFTAGGSEADVLALRGAALARRDAGRRIVTAATEHHAVLHALDALAADGFEIVVLPTDERGVPELARFEAALTPGTILASVMLANNETGAVAPIAAFASAARARGVLFHTDAVQAPGRLALDVDELGVDLLSLSAHKFYGPKGVGALYVRAGTPLVPLVVGGGQEAGLRAGTENVAGIVGFARALRLATAEREESAARMSRLRDRLEVGVLERIAEVRRSTASGARLPNTAHLAFANLEATTLATRLDLDGVAVSTGSACAAGATEPSHVVRALALPGEYAGGTVRFSLGRATVEREIDAVIDLLVRIVPEVRGFSPRTGYTARRLPGVSSEVTSDG